MRTWGRKNKRYSKMKTKGEMIFRSKTMVKKILTFEAILVKICSSHIQFIFFIPNILVARCAFTLGHDNQI
jgi:hypothetical protein